MVISHLFCWRSVLHDTNAIGERKDEILLQDERTALDGTVWRKIDTWILPLCTLFFLVAMVDVASIGNARVAGFQVSLGISDYQYTIALTVTYVPYILAQIPFSLLLKSVGPNVILPALMTLWSVASAAQGFVNSFSELLACRFFLGLMEAGLFPCIVLYLTSFYPWKMLQLRIAIFYTSASLSGAFSGLLAAAINQVRGMGGKPGWAWIFILEGAITFVFGGISFFLLPRSPETARFLTQKEREYVISTLKDGGSMSKEDSEDRFNWAEIIRAAKSPHVWLLAVVIFFNGTILFGLAFFEPVIVAGLGYSGNHAQLMSVPPFATTFVLSFISAILSDRYQRRGYTVIFFSLLQLVGFVMYYASTSNRVRYASLFFSISGAYGAPPALLAWLANNSAPHTRRATAIAACTSVTQVGGMLATWLLGWLSPAPDYAVATLTFVGMSVCMSVIAAANLAFLRRENRRKEESRRGKRREEEPEGLGDRSAWFIYSL